METRESVKGRPFTSAVPCAEASVAAHAGKEPSVTENTYRMMCVYVCFSLVVLGLYFTNSCVRLVCFFLQRARRTARDTPSGCDVRLLLLLFCGVFYFLCWPTLFFVSVLVWFWWTCAVCSPLLFWRSRTRESFGIKISRSGGRPPGSSASPSSAKQTIEPFSSGVCVRAPAAGN